MANRMFGRRAAAPRRIAGAPARIAPAVRKSRRVCRIKILSRPALVQRPSQDILRNLLDASVRSMRRHPVAPWQHVARRRGETLRPPNGRRIENEILFGARIDGRGPANGPVASTQGDAFGYYLESRKIGRLAVKLPAHESRNKVTLFDSSAGEDPMAGFGDDPVAAAIVRVGAPRSHQQALAGTFHGKGELISRLLLFSQAAVASGARDDAIRAVVGACAERRHPADRVAA